MVPALGLEAALESVLRVGEIEGVDDAVEVGDGVEVEVVVGEGVEVGDGVEVEVVVGVGVEVEVVVGVCVEVEVGFVTEFAAVAAVA